MEIYKIFVLYLSLFLLQIIKNGSSKKTLDEKTNTNKNIIHENILRDFQQSSSEDNYLHKQSSLSLENKTKDISVENVRQEELQIGSHYKKVQRKPYRDKERIRIEHLSNSSVLTSSNSSTSSSTTDRSSVLVALNDASSERKASTKSHDKHSEYSKDESNDSPSLSLSVPNILFEIITEQSITDTEDLYFEETKTNENQQQQPTTLEEVESASMNINKSSSENESMKNGQTTGNPSNYLFSKEKQAIVNMENTGLLNTNLTHDENKRFNVNNHKETKDEEIRQININKNHKTNKEENVRKTRFHHKKKYAKHHNWHRNITNLPLKHTKIFDSLSHEIPAPHGIKETFVITAANNIIFFKEKRFVPQSRNIRKLLETSDFHAVPPPTHSLHQYHNASLVSFTNAPNRNRNERDAQNKFDTDHISGARKDIFKQLKQTINSGKRGNSTRSKLSTLASSTNYLMSDGRFMYEDTQKGKECTFETKCDWTWSPSGNFKVTSARDLVNVGPKWDADNNTDGHFLFLRVSTARELKNVTSPRLAPSGEECRLELWLHQGNMNATNIKIIGQYTDIDVGDMSWIVHEMYGNTYESWQKFAFKIGRQSQEFRLMLEVNPSLAPAHIAVDNIRLVQCWPERAKQNRCVPHQFRCATTNVCINTTQVCDINRDCIYGEDEQQDCDKIPFGARCDFEEGWCGWHNGEGREILWSHQDGSMPNKTGPSRDHTYLNSTGHYLYVDMVGAEKRLVFASTASLYSVILNPPPQVHSNVSSRYYNSCSIRFYYHQFGYHKSGLALMITMIKPKENETREIWWSFADHGDKWKRNDVILPKISYRYILQFDAKKGIRPSDIALDDISLSPECFGLNIPAKDLNGYNYWNPQIFDEDSFKETHKDFVNETYYKFTTCGASGRMGPVQDNCTKAYNNTPVVVDVQRKNTLQGIQKWIVPTDGFYTIIAKGASGGKGSGGMGSSRASVVRAVVELFKGERLYILVGQEGSDACIKSLGKKFNSPCQVQPSDSNHTLTGIHGVLHLMLQDGGGGGGGGTYIFVYQKVNHTSEPKKEPLVIAAGSGGLGIGRFVDIKLQHGQGINTTRKPYNGQVRDNKSGAGGGWFGPKNNLSSINGQSLIDGGVGGTPCYISTDGVGSGGFGGGGGGCTYGGGGGGYAGGNSWALNTSNGEGGTSFINNRRSMPQYNEVLPAQHSGPGEVLIIPVNNLCGCDYRCLALDEHRATVTCICPPDWLLSSNNRTCILREDPAESTKYLFALLMVIVIFFVIAVGAFCIILYNRYVHKKNETMRRKMLSGPELQLNRLRMQSDSMMTEYNPNYEFGGVIYTLKDLKEIPRDQLRLVKALGQGAFGEVYQGFYKARQSDTVEMPVAVKTLPEMSTSAAETDFLMEALIMSKFNHPNIVHFIGVCFDKHPRFIVLELLAGGDLKNFLRESRPKPERMSPLTMKDLVLISIDVAKACKYMEDNRFIHRDIAARNCLLTTKGPGRVVKIADFGMSRDIYRSDYYRKGGKAMLPIKWMPPEAFLDGIFTSKTDVWSFGVLLWEIMSMGYMPYTGCANRQVMQLVTNGGRLEPPSSCPSQIYAIMTQCWHPSPEQRPTFTLLLERLGYCLQDPDVINNPLPVFTKAPSAERDATIVRPRNAEESYLQIPRNADYLVPTPCDLSQLPNLPDLDGIDDGSVERLLGDNSEGNSDSWETSFVMPQSKSTQPLLQDNEHSAVNAAQPTVQNLINIDTPQLTPTSTEPNDKTLMNHVNHNHNNNIKAATQPTIDVNNTNVKSGVSLDASSLIQQSSGPKKKPYVNVTPGKESLTNFPTKNGPYTIENTQANSFVNGKKPGYLNNDTEISC